MKREKNNITEIARLGDAASVELITITEHEVLQVNFMNLSFRLCRKQFEKFIIMLNEAMIQLVKDDPYYSDMKKFFSYSQSFLDTENINDSDKKDKLN